MRKVLVVAYYFPPFGGGGVQRTAKFVKYLPEFGWCPVVLTVDERCVGLRDRSLEEEVAPHIPVYRTSALLFPPRFPWRLRNFIGRWLLLVDQQVGWLPFAVRHGLEIIRREGVEAIYTTSAPYTAHLIGLQLNKRAGLPWVADFRDPWVGNFSSRFPTPLHERIARWLERRVVGAADRLTVVSEPMRQALLTRYSHLGSDEVQVLTNGYDPTDFEGVEPFGQDDDRLVILYSGSFYGERQTPFCFLRAIQRALDKGQIPRHKIRVLFVGSMNSAFQGQVKESHLSDVVTIPGYVTHRQSVGYLLGADVLLLIIGSGPGSEAVFTGKIFEYLAAGKPILALVPPGVAADLVREAQVGVVVEPEDAQAIADQIAILYQQWRRSTLTITGNQEVIARYNRRRLTADLAAILDRYSLAGGGDDGTSE
jgi:glycosyltransferase involved in cell wall biosynthesis